MTTYHVKIFGYCRATACDSFMDTEVKATSIDEAVDLAAEKLPFWNLSYAKARELGPNGSVYDYKPEFTTVTRWV